MPDFFGEDTVSANQTQSQKEISATETGGA